MNNEKIFELAAQFDDDKPDFVMSTEAVIAFARAVIEEEREQSSFMTLRPSNGVEIMHIDKEGMVFMGQRITDAGEAYEAWLKTMAMMQGQYAQPKYLLTDKEIDDVIKNHRFYYGIDASAYSFARAIGRKIWEKAE